MERFLDFCEWCTGKVLNQLSPGCVGGGCCCLIFLFGKFNIFHRPDEAMLFVMVKVCLRLKIYLFYGTFENFVLLININKQNERLSFTGF